MRKFLIGFIMIVTLLATQVGMAAAQATTLTGTVQSVTQSTDGMGKTIFIVTVLLSDGVTTQTVRLDQATAVADGIITVDPITQAITFNTGASVTIDMSTVLPDPCTLPTGANQPVSAALTKFFCGSLGLDYTTLQSFRTEGFGFGVIAQACFMAEALGGNALTCSNILMDKQNKDFSNLPECSSSTNWGQLKKCVAVQALDNLGGVMSGQLTPGQSGRSHGNGNGNGGGNGNGHGHGNGHNP